MRAVAASDHRSCKVKLIPWRACVGCSAFRGPAVPHLRTTPASALRSSPFLTPIFSTVPCSLELGVNALRAYVDLNPIRTDIAKAITTSLHTGVRLRALALQQNPQAANLAMRPLAGLVSANFPRISTADYIELVDWTGRQLHPDKRGVIDHKEPPALRLLGLEPGHWTMQVKGIGRGYWRAVGTVQELLLKAEAMGQKWLCGIGFARLLKS